MKNLQRMSALLLLSALLLALFSGCAAQPAAPAPAETVTFTDDTGRQVEIPKDVTRVAPSGAVATMFLATVCPEYMVCINAEPDAEQCHYIGESLLGLPAAGQLYGSKSTLNLEALLSSQPQIIIDLGDYKPGMEEDLNALQEQTKLPVVFIQADLPHMAAAFRSMGKIFAGKAERCEELAAYVEETVALANENSAKIPEAERLSVAYTTGASGLDTNARGSSQAQVLELVGAVNAVEVDEVSNKGGGNPVNMEQMYLFDPDVIVFSSDSIYAEVGEDPAWSKLRAVQQGTYYEIPGMPYNWLSGPPSLNMLLGVRWLGNLLYPALYDYDMAAETKRAFKILWNCELTDEETAALLARSTLKPVG